MEAINSIAFIMHRYLRNFQDQYINISGEIAVKWNFDMFSLKYFAAALFYDTKYEIIRFSHTQV